MAMRYHLTRPIFARLISDAFIEGLSIEYYLRIFWNGEYHTDETDMFCYGHIDFDRDECYTWFLLRYG